MDGPSILPLHDKARRLLATWVKIIWPKLPKKGSNNVSLQNDGSSFHGWTIGRSLPEIWRKSVVCLDLTVTAIDIRWWIVNTTHEKKTQGASFDECNLRRKMCHSHKTSRCYYLMANPTEVANRGLDIIIQCTNIDPKPNAMRRVTNQQIGSVMWTSTIKTISVSLTNNTKQAPPLSVQATRTVTLNTAKVTLGISPCRVKLKDP